MKSPIININKIDKNHLINFEPSDEELKKIEEEVDNLLSEEN